MSIDPDLKGLWKGAFMGMVVQRIPDDFPLRMLGDYYEEHGHKGCSDACKRTNPHSVPLLTYLQSLGYSAYEADDIRSQWICECWEEQRRSLAG